MKPDRLAGAALIVGAVAVIVTMALHPTGHSIENIHRQAALSVGVHALAIAGLCVQAFGFLRFTRAIRPRRPLAEAGLVAFAMAVVTGTLAATAGGFISSALAEHALNAPHGEPSDWHVAFTLVGLINGAFNSIFVTALSVAIIIWSLTLLRLSTAATVLGAVGVIIGVAAVAALLTGNLHHTVHDVGMFLFSTSGWTIALGVMLCRRVVGASAMVTPSGDDNAF